MTGTGRLAVFGPDPLLSVTIERRGEDDDVHVHAGGQGVWSSAWPAASDAWPILCGFTGGETGAVILPLLDTLPGEHRLVTTAGASGGYVVDRRTSERRLIAKSLRPAPERHEVDDLVSATCAAALGSSLLVVCNPFPTDGFPDEMYETVVANVRAAGIPVIVDMSSRRLDRALRHRPDLVKPQRLGARRVRQRTRGRPATARRRAVAARRGRGSRRRDQGRGARPRPDRRQRPVRDRPAEAHPRLRGGLWRHDDGAARPPRGAGRSRDALVLGAAAGAGNFLRHGLGTGRRATIEELAERVVIRPVSALAPASSAGSRRDY